MNLAEKIMKLRKEQGWSQETLASMLDVSRQSVSKWEIGTSVPDLDKIIKMSEIFDVTTDYLLKENFDTFSTHETEEPTNASPFSDSSDDATKQGRTLDTNEVISYLDFVIDAAKQIGIGVSLCILSPVCLILLSGLSEYNLFSFSGNQASGIGITILVLLIAAAVTLFISKGIKSSKYEYLNEEAFFLDNDAYDIVKKRQANFEESYKKYIIVGVALCICSVIPYFIAIAFDSSSLLYVCCTAVLLTIIAVAVYLFIYASTIYESFQRLLKKENSTQEENVHQKHKKSISQLYWSFVLALYLGYSLFTMHWHTSWIIWPCAKVLYSAAIVLAGMIHHDTDQKDLAGK